MNAVKYIDNNVISSGNKLNIFFIIRSIIMFITTVSEDGIHLDSIFIIKFPLTILLFPSSASMNDGIPIVNIVIRVNCIGIKKYLVPVTIQINIRNIVNIVFVNSRDALLSILLIILLPSFIMCGILLKLESNNTSSLTFLLASLPHERAILQSASLRASTSFTQSPVIATVLPCFLSALTIFFF